MCCFSRPVRFVGATKIFARAMNDGSQALAYGMSVELGEELAMVLPLPCPPRPAEDAVRFIDLSGYAGFFDDLAKAFPMIAPQGKSRAVLGPAAIFEKKLVVHDVGDFEASFVPSRADFARLDARFRLADGVWDKLPQYADWSFAVFKLKPKAAGTRQTIHPMAFTFPRRDARALFFPTVHVHDGGSVPEAATFDHSLYCQADGVLNALLDWQTSMTALGASVDAARAKGLVDGERKAHTTALFGSMPNEDQWLREPAGVALSDLRGEGASFAWELAARALFTRATNDQWAAWKRSCEADLPLLARGISRALTELTAARAAAWKLGAKNWTLPAHFMNGPKLWKGDDWMTQGGAASGGSAGYVRFAPFTKRVEPQAITLFFDEVPNEERTTEIDAELRHMLDAIVAP
jgi:hypothetical protein